MGNSFVRCGEPADVGKRRSFVLRTGVRWNVLSREVDMSTKVQVRFSGMGACVGITLVACYAGFPGDHY